MLRKICSHFDRMANVANGNERIEMCVYGFVNLQITLSRND